MKTVFPDSRTTSPSTPLTAGDLLDAALHHCQNLAAIAGLLKALGPRNGWDTLAPETLVGTGWLIAEQTEQLQNLLRAAHEQLGHSPEPCLPARDSG